MPDSKPLASLSSGLLARKGGARPAMRRQNVISPASGDHSTQEDLGWNDMGYDVDPPKNPLPSAISTDDDGADERKAGILSAAIPEVVKQQDALHRKYVENISQAPAETAEAPAQAAEPMAKDAAVETPSVDDMPAIKAAEDEAPEDVTAEDISENSPASSKVSDAPDMPQSPLLRKKTSAKNAVHAPQNSFDEVSRAPEPSYDSEPSHEEEGQAEKTLADAHAILSKKPAKKPSETAQISADEQPKKRPLPKTRNASSKRAAFTLRLDKERHLRLRLACAISNQSAQNMVTEALDEFLANMPELDAVAKNLPETAQN